MERTQTFQRLKGPCVQLGQAVVSFAQDPGRGTDIVRALTQLLDTLEATAARPSSIDDRFADYVFFPIANVLKLSRQVPVRALELSLRCLFVLLTTGWRTQIAPDLAGQLLVLLTFLADPESSGKGVTAISEELQIHAFNCMAELFATLSSTSSGRASLTSTANIPGLGNAVLVVVSGLTTGASTEIQLSALAAFEALCITIEDQDALASFLPKMVSSVTKILTWSSTSRTNHRLLIRGSDVLSMLLAHVLGDAATKDLPDTSSRITNSATNQGDHPGQRNTAWLQATAGQIRLALANVVKLREHEKDEVRNALFRLCLNLLEHCRHSLSNCLSILMDTLINVAANDRQGTNESAVKGLLRSDQKFTEQLRSSVYGWVNSLPRLIHSKNDRTRQQLIQQVSMSVRLLAEEGINLSLIERLLALNLRDSVSNLLSEARGVGTIIESTPHDVLVQSKTWLKDTGSTTFNALIQGFKGQNETMEELKVLLRQLAISESALVVARDLIHSIYAEQGEAQVASFWLSLNILKEVSSQSIAFADFLDLDSSLEEPQTALLDELYSFSRSTITEADLDSDIDWRLSALALEALALQAKQCKEDFKVELVDTLYPVIHLVGSSNAALRNHAITCLNIISDSCGYATTSDLIVSNIDYLVNAVALRLNTLEISPQAPQVLLMMIRLSGPSLLPYLDDVLGSIFSALENFHGYPKLVELLFAVLKGIAEEGARTPQLAITTANDEKTHRNERSQTEIADVVAVITAMKTTTYQTDDQFSPEKSQRFPQKPWHDESIQDIDTRSELPDTVEGAESAQIPEPPPPTPKTFELLLKISQLTQHYLTAASPSLRTSLLSLLNTTIPALAKHENSLLPLINTLWPVLLPRLSDPEAYVVCNTLEVIRMMCTHAGDFMKGRIESIWEHIQAIHERTVRTTKGRMLSNVTPLDVSRPRQSPGGGGVLVLSDSSASSGQQDYYVDAPARMIWDGLVRLLNTIAGHVTVNEEMFDEMLDMLGPLLNREDVVKAMGSRNSDALWLHQLRLHGCPTIDTALSPSPVNEPSLPLGQPDWKFAPLSVR